MKTTKEERLNSLTDSLRTLIEQRAAYSNAETMCGKLRAALRAMRKRKSRVRPLPRTSRYSKSFPSYVKPRRFTDEERRVRRAWHDAEYRAARTQQLVTELATVCATFPVGEVTLCAITEWYDAAHDRAHCYYEAVAELRAIHGDSFVVPELPKTLPGVVLLHDGADIAKKCGAKIVRRGAEFGVYATAESSRYEYASGETEWKRGRPVNYCRARNDSYYRSFARICSSGVLDVAIHTTEYALLPPSGFRWDVDSNGLRLVDVTDNDRDLHFDAEDCWKSRKGFAWAIEAIEANAKLRAQQAEQLAKDTTDFADVYVCFADSRRAGNCASGTRSFALKHKLDVARHYPAALLLRHANGDSHRVRLACKAAKEQQDIDNARGYSLLEEHCVY